MKLLKPVSKVLQARLQAAMSEECAAVTVLATADTENTLNTDFTLTQLQLVALYCDQQHASEEHLEHTSEP